VTWRATLSYALLHVSDLLAPPQGPSTRCYFPPGLPAPPAEYTQINLLPVPPATQPSWTAVAADLQTRLAATSPPMEPLLVRLAYQCASTYRGTDYQGGCNGARIRIKPGADWPENKGLNAALSFLTPTHDKFSPLLSWADLVVLAGTVAVERASGGGLSSLPFCGGRSDAAADDLGWPAYLQSGLTGGMSDTGALLLDKIDQMGMSRRDFVALMGAHSMGTMHANVSGYDGPWAYSSVGALSNVYFSNLLKSSFTLDRRGQYYVVGPPSDPLGFALHTDVLLTFTPELAEHAVDFANDNAAFLSAFGTAWTKLMNADRYNGSTGSLCFVPAPTPTAAPSPKGTSAVSLVAAGLIGVGASGLVMGAGAALLWWHRGRVATQKQLRFEEEEDVLNAPLVADEKETM